MVVTIGQHQDAANCGAFPLWADYFSYVGSFALLFGRRSHHPSLMVGWWLLVHGASASE